MDVLGSSTGALCHRADPCAEPRNHPGLRAGALNTPSVSRMRKGSHKGGQETKYF